MISDIIAGLIQGLFVIIDNLVTKGRIKETVKDHIVKNEFIYKRLNNLLQDVSANRISIRQYHNGGNYFTGLPMQRYSSTYEAVSEGISSEMQNDQNKLVSEFPTLHSSIIKDGSFYIEDTSKLEDEGLKQKLTHRGVKSFYVYGIWDINDNLIGTIRVDYVMTIHEMTDKDKEEIADFARLVVGYLMPTPETSSKNKTVIFVILFILLFLSVGQVLFFCTTIYNIVHFLLIKFHF